MTFQIETANDFLNIDPILTPGASKGFVVIHPLHDAPEAKCNLDQAGELKLSRGCRWALVSLRFYLIGTMLMGAWRVVELVRH